MSVSEIPSLDIIIVNWNSGEYLYECLRSIAGTRKDILEFGNVVVVDNASTDNSLSGIENIKLPLYIIKNSTNRGFAAACNQGAKNCASDYLLFLNPDTRLFKDSLTKPIELMEDEKNRNIGITGIQLVNEKGEIARTCARFPTLGQFFSKISGLNLLFPNLFRSYFMTEWDHKESKVVDHVMGAFFLVRRYLFEALGGFDERFFVYLEDLDFSYRAKEFGFYSYYLTSTRVFHKGGSSSEKVNGVRLFYSLRSRILYSYKHFVFFSATLILLLTILIEPFSRLILAGLHRSIREAEQTFKAYGLLLRDLPNVVRRSAQRRGSEDV